MNQQFLVEIFLRRFHNQLEIFANNVEGGRIKFAEKSDELIFMEKIDALSKFQKCFQHISREKKTIRVDFKYLRIFINSPIFDFDVYFEGFCDPEIHGLKLYRLEDVLSYQKLYIEESFPGSLIFFNKIYKTYSILKNLDSEFITTYDLFDSLHELGKCLSVIHHCINKRDGFLPKIELIQNILEDIQNKYDHYLSPEGLKGSNVINGLVASQKEESKEESSDEDCSSEFLNKAEDFLSKRGF